MDNIKEKVAEFLKNRDVRDKIFLQDGGRQAYLYKVKYNDTTDFIYGCYGYRESPLSFKGKMEGQGFIHYPTMMLNAAGYEMRSISGFESDYGFATTDEIEISSKYAEMLSAEVIKLAEIAGLFDAVKQGDYQIQPIVDSWGRHQEDDLESVVDRSKELANKAYAEHKIEISYTPYFPKVALSEAEIVEFLDDGELFVKNKANKFFAENKPNISNAIFLDYLINKHLISLNSAEGGHSKFRAMADSITDQKTVTLDVVRDGVPLTIKYDAEYLKRCLKNTENSIWNWNMDAPSRREFEKTYGKRAELMASDIVAIRYGKKTLWESN